MLIRDAMEEFCLDCKVKKYSPRTIRNTAGKYYIALSQEGIDVLRRNIEQL